MQGASKNLIVSHGGRHGAGGTYLQGQPIPDEVLPFVPKEVIGRVSSQAVAPAAVAAPTPAVDVAAVPPAPQPIAESAPTHAPIIDPTSNTVPAAAPQPAAPPTPELPRNRRDLFIMNKEQALTVAAQLGMTIVADETAKALKERIQERLGL